MGQGQVENYWECFGTHEDRVTTDVGEQSAAMDSGEQIEPLVRISVLINDLWRIRIFCRHIRSSDKKTI